MVIRFSILAFLLATSLGMTAQNAPVGDTASVKKLEPMPKMNFKTKYYNFGVIKKGDKPTFVYEFTNTGLGVLDIEIVSGCDCTELDYTQNKVKPGESGFVKATFNSNRAEPDEIGIGKPLNKTITIVLKNTDQRGYPMVDELKFDVQVEN